MSYVLRVWDYPDAASLPSTIDAVVKLVDQLSENRGEQLPKFPILAARLTGHFPCLTASRSRSSKAKLAWADGPIDGQCESLVYSIGINRDLLDEVRSLVVVEANALGLHVLDEQAGDAFFATGEVLTPRDEGYCVRGFASYFAKDWTVALAEFRKLSEKKNGAAQHSLAVMYLNGEGVAMNPVIAYALFNLAANCHYSHSIAARKQVAQSLSKRAIQEARSLSVKMFISGKVGDIIDEYLSHSLPESEIYAPGRLPGETDTHYAKRLKRLAEKGDPESQIQLGEIYRTSFVVRRSLTTALKWFRLAAECGSAEAQFKLGDMLKDGHGTRQNYAEAIKWFLLAADSGHVEACFRVGWFQERGWGVNKNIDEAMARYIHAAEAGSAGAQMWLATVYLSGKIVPKDEQESARWERLAAAQAVPTSIRGLAMHYFGGRLAPKSMLITYSLRRLASILNPTDERDTIFEMAGERLTADERKRADLLVIELAKPDNFLPALERASSKITP